MKKQFNFFGFSFLCFIGLSFLTFKSSLGFEVVSASYSISGSNLLGKDILFANFRVEFDEELFLTQPSFCLAPDECLNFGESDEDYCDYSLKNSQCGIHNVTGEFCSLSDVCDESVYDWKKLVPNQKITVDVGEFEVSKFRFYFNPPNCSQSIRILSNEIYGIATQGMSQGKYEDRAFSPEWDFFWYAHRAQFCPRQKAYGFGTYFLGVWAHYNSKTKVEITLEILDINMEDKKEIRPISDFKCPSGSSLMICPSFGEPFSGSLLSRNVYILTIPVNECFQFMIHTEIVSVGRGLLIMIFKQDDIPFSVSGYTMIESRAPFVLTVCPPEGKNQSTLYITMTTESSELNFLYYLSKNKDEWNSEMIPLREFNPYIFVEEVTGLLQLSCTSKTFNCFPGARSLSGSCSEFFISMPRKDFNFLWPVPLTIEDSVTDYVLIEEENPQDTLVGNRLDGNLILKLYSESGVISSLPNWEEELSECELYFETLSDMASINGELPKGRIPLKSIEMNEECSFENFQKILKKFDDINVELNNGKTFEEITTSRYLMDSYSFSVEWQSCDQKMRNLLDEKISMKKFSSSTQCTLSMLKNESLLETDNCCKKELRWETCCIPREVETEQSTLSVGKNSKESIGMVCKSSECVEKALEDYIFYDFLLDSVSGCGSIVDQDLEVFQNQEMRFYKECKVKVYGSDQNGKECLENKQCGSEKCNLFTSKCLIEESEIEKVANVFFECLIEEMPESVRNLMTEEILKEKQETGNEENTLTVVSDEELKKYLEENYMSQDCNHINDGRSEMTTRYELISTVSEGICGSTDWYCYDKYCDIPLEIERNIEYGRDMTLCPRNMAFRKTPQRNCEGSSICNWNSSLLTSTNSSEDQYIKEECENGTLSTKETFFCGVCESEIDCVELELSEEECKRMMEEEIEVCVSKSGHVDWTIKEASQCFEKVGECSVQCLSQGNCSKSLCENSGRCNDQDILDLAQFVYSHKDRETLDGLCLSKMNPWNKDDCNRGLSTVTTDRDPIKASDFPFGSYCVRPNNQTLCDIFKKNEYWWWTMAKNQEECEQRLSSCEESWIPTTLKSSKDIGQCEICGGEFESTFEWEKGQWRGGKMMKVEWRQRKLVEQYYWGNGVNFEKLSQTIVEGVSTEYYKKLVTEAQCRLVPTRRTLEELVCVCEKGEDQCGSSHSNQVEVGVGEVCSQTQTEIVAPPGLITFHNDSFKEQMSCVSLGVIAESTNEIRQSESTSLSLSYRSERNKRYNVWNEKGGTVGSVIGRGVELKFEGTFGDILTNVKVCLMFDHDLVSSMEYDELVDLGLKIENEVRPLEKEIEFENDLMCGMNINISSLKTTYFPIIRKINWETEEKDQYSNSQIGVYCLMLVLYFIPLSILLYHQISLGTELRTNLFFYLSFILAVLVRFIYFLGLLVAQPNDAETVLEFLAIAFPTFAYLSAVSGAAMLWAFIKSPRNKETTKILVIIVNIFLYFVFIVCAVLFFVLKDDGSYSCYGRVYEEPDTSDINTLRIVYSSILCFISLVLASIVLYYSGSLIISLRRMNAAEANPRIRGWLIVTVVISTSVFFQCIFSMVYSLSIEASYEYALVLILFEILPSCSILQLVMTVERVSYSKKSSMAPPYSTNLPDLNSKEATVEGNI